MCKSHYIYHRKSILLPVAEVCDRGFKLKLLVIVMFKLLGTLFGFCYSDSKIVWQCGYMLSSAYTLAEVICG